jgi:mRNA-degrading endonuclease RelE of RelBE toxin-antitoxin system
VSWTPCAIAWDPDAKTDLRGLDAVLVRRIARAVTRYAETGQGDVKRLRGVVPAQWRLRVGDWRARFALSADTVTVLRVLPRGSAYR